LAQPAGGVRGVMVKVRILKSGKRASFVIAGEGPAPLVSTKEKEDDRTEGRGKERKVGGLWKYHTELLDHRRD